MNYLRIGRDNAGGSSVDQLRLRKANLDVLSSFGDVIIEIICRDTVAGHDVRRYVGSHLGNSNSFNLSESDFVL